MVIFFWKLLNYWRKRLEKFSEIITKETQKNTETIAFNFCQFLNGVYKQIFWKANFNFFLKY